MLSLQKLSKTIAKLKNQISSATNYIQLQTAIDLFAQLKRQHGFLPNQTNEIKKKKTSNQESVKLDEDEKRKLLQTTEELIKEKIKYFKKIALKKMDSINKNKQQPNIVSKKGRQQVQMGKKRKGNKEAKIFQNEFSTLTLPNKRLSHEAYSFLSECQQMRQLKALEREKQALIKRIDLGRKQSGKDEMSRQLSQSEKKLKQSKSVDNLFSNVRGKENFTFRNQTSGKKPNQDSMNQTQGGFVCGQYQDNSYQLDDDSKTQIKVFKQRGKLYDLGQEGIDAKKQDFQYYKNKAEFLQKMIGSVQLVTGGASQNVGQVFEQFHYRLRERTLELQEVKGRLRYYEQLSQQLRNRVMNEQRRHQDYISGLKEQLKRFERQKYQMQREKKMMDQLVRELQIKIEVQDKEKARYLEQIQSLLKEKEKAKQQQKNSAQQMRKQLELMARQEANLRQVESMLRQQQVETSVVEQKNASLLKDNQTLTQQLKASAEEKELLEQLLELKLQEIEQFKLQVYQLKRNNDELSHQLAQVISFLFQTKLDIDTMRREQWQEEKRKETLIKKKVEKLKSVKSLLADTLA